MITGFVGHIVYYGIGLIMICTIITICSALLYLAKMLWSFGSQNVQIASQEEKA